MTNRRVVPNFSPLSSPSPAFGQFFNCAKLFSGGNFSPRDPVLRRRRKRDSSWGPGRRGEKKTRTEERRRRKKLTLPTVSLLPSPADSAQRRNRTSNSLSVCALLEQASVSTRDGKFSFYSFFLRCFYRSLVCYALSSFLPCSSSSFVSPFLIPGRQGGKWAERGNSFSQPSFTRFRAHSNLRFGFLSRMDGLDWWYPAFSRRMIMCN